MAYNEIWFYCYFYKPIEKINNRKNNVYLPTSSLTSSSNKTNNVPLYEPKRGFCVCIKEKKKCYIIIIVIIAVIDIIYYCFFNKKDKNSLKEI